MNYNIELLDLVSELAPIQQQLKFFKKDDDTIALLAQQMDKKIVYCLEAPAADFEFPGEAVRFFDYKKFKSFFDIFNISGKEEELNDTPILDVNLNDAGEVYDIIIKSSKGKQQFTYRTACEGAIDTPTFKGIDFKNLSASFTMSEAQVNHLQKMINLIQDKTERSGIKFQAKDDILTVSFMCLATSNSYKIEYKLDNPVQEEFTFSTDKEGICLLPSAEYAVSIDSRGLIRLHMNRDDNIKLDLYISKQKVVSAGRA